MVIDTMKRVRQGDIHGGLFDDHPPSSCLKLIPIGIFLFFVSPRIYSVGVIGGLESSVAVPGVVPVAD